ncbi:MAG TPA: tetratricopeptide repeat protein [Planctomycetota bacterium]
MPTAVPLALVLVAAALPQEGLRTRRSKEAIVKANTSKDVAEAVGRRIDRFCQVFQAFYDELGLEKKSDNMLAARLFDTFEEFDSYYRRTVQDADPPLAYFSPSLNAIVLYNDEADVTLRQTLFHESSHQYLARYTADAPKWLNEGLAEYFEGWRMTPEGELVEKRPNLYDLKLLQDWLKGGKYLAPKILAGYTAQEFNDFKKLNPHLHPYLHYVTAWGMVYFSLELSDDDHDRTRLIQYLADLNEKGPRASFAPEDWDAFEARWKKAVLALEVQPVDAIDHVLLAGGHRQSGEWKEAAALYQKAWELDPRTPDALYWIGFCHKRLGDYEKALEWLEKARAGDATDPWAPYQMARITLGIDKKGAQGDAPKALALAETAAKLAPDSAAVLELLARCQAATGDGAGAVKTIKRILKGLEDEGEKARYEALQKELGGK